MSRYSISLGTLFAMSTFGAGALVLVACAGKVIGSGGPLQTVSASEINQPVVACGGGYAHPNVCCDAGAGKTSTCGVFPGAPFQSCGSGFSTYPDPRSCCSLDGSGDCIAPPPVPTPTPVPPGCSYACPAGQYEPAGSPGTCCFDDGTTTVCSASSSGSGCGSCACACPAGGPCPPCDCPPEPSCLPPPPPSPPTCACPACPVGAPCPLCVCDADGGPAPTPVCNTCPPGWQVPAGEPLLCCNDSGGAIECFSQGVPPTPTPVPITFDAGPPVPGPHGSGAHCGGNTAHPAKCAAGLVCTPVPGSTAPFGDVGGTCH